MDYPGKLSELTDEDILRQYSRSGLKPVSKAGVNGIIRDLYLQLKEVRAFSADLVKRGKIRDTGAQESLSNAIGSLEGYVRGLEKSTYTTEYE